MYVFLLIKILLYIVYDIFIIFLGKDYLLEALNFHSLKSQKIITIPKTIRCKPRQSGGLQKVCFCFNKFTFTVIS